MLSGYAVRESHLMILVAFVALSAALSDLRSHRIPNWLTCLAAIAGMSYHMYQNCLGGLLTSGGGLLLGLALLMPFYFLGGMGAGDVKLMSAMGALLGPAGVFKAWLLSALAGGVYAVLLLLRVYGIRCVTSVGISAVLTSFSPSRTVFAMANKERGIRLCYGVAIALGTLLSLFIH